MIDLIGVAIGGTLLVGTSYYERLYKALEKNSDRIRSKQYHQADRALRNVLRLPYFPWERSLYAIVCNLHACVKLRLDDAPGAKAILDRVQSLQGLDTAIKALTYSNLAHLAPTSAESTAYLSQSKELWDLGRKAIKKPKLWQVLGLYFYTIADHEKALECYDELALTSYSSQALTMKVFASVNREPEEIIERAQEALRFVTHKRLRFAIHLLLSATYQQAGNLDAAYLYTEKCLQVYTKYQSGLREILYRQAMNQLRILERYEEAEDARKQLFHGLSRQDVLRKCGILHDEGEYETCYDLVEPYFDSEDTQFTYAIGVTLQELGKIDAALPFLHKAQELDRQTISPKFQPPSNYFLIYNHCAAHRYEQAWEILHQAEDLPQHWACEMRAYLAYFWKGDPNLARQMLPQMCWSALVYEGDFQALVAYAETFVNKNYKASSRGLYLAKKHYYRATALAWGSQHAEAAKEYKTAERHFLGSPLDRSRSRLWGLTCAARAGEDVFEELRAVQASLLESFGDNLELVSEIRASEQHDLFLNEQYRAVIDGVTDALTHQPRRFEQARLLVLKIKALEKLGKPEEAQIDRSEIQHLAPESFLDSWAQGDQAPA